MIKKEITVHYWVRVDNQNVALNYEDLAEKNENIYDIEAYEYKRTYHVFKNNGMVSKTDCSKHDIINRKAEELLQKQLKIESECKADMEKAIRLKKIVDSAFKDGDESPMFFDTIIDGDFDDSVVPNFVTIKVKTSHSKWYQGAGALNAPSNYFVMVPQQVEKQAKELQAIRKKHQNDENFDFIATDYKKKIVRVADHINDNWF